MGAVRHYIFGPLASDFTLSSLFLGAVLEISSVCTSPYLAIDILVDCLGATMEIHSDLQMAASDGLQLGQPQPGLELGYQAQLSESHHEHESYSGDRKEYTYGHTENEGHQPKTICGLRPATLWLALALGAVIVIAAVGGGVGATLAAKRLWSYGPCLISCHYQSV